jgi:hypothetical protein
MKNAIPQTIQKWIEKNAEKVESYHLEKDGYSENEHSPYAIWMYLKNDWFNPLSESDAIHAATVEKFMEAAKGLKLGVDEGYAWRAMTGAELLAAESKVITGTVKVTVKQGMKARIDPEYREGEIHKGREFIVSSDPRELCGTEVVALENLDGSRFSAAYDLSMLQITDTMEG